MDVLCNTMTNISNLDHIYVIISSIHEQQRIDAINNVLKNIPKDKYTFVEPYWKGHTDKQLYVDNIKFPVYHHLTEGAACIYLTYTKLMDTFLASEHNTVLVLESDVFAVEGWEEMLQTALEEWKGINGYKNSMIFLGNGCNLKPNVTHKHVTERLYETHQTRCLDSWIWTKESVEKLRPLLLPITAPLDIFLNRLYNDTTGIKSYYLEPSIFIQGSQNGAYASNVQ